MRKKPKNEFLFVRFCADEQMRSLNNAFKENKDYLRRHTIKLIFGIPGTKRKIDLNFSAQTKNYF